MRLLPLLALMLLMTCGARTVGSGKHCLGVHLVGTGGKVVVVPVRIDGKGPYQMVLDTGSTNVLLSSATAHDLHLTPIPSIVHAGGAHGALRAQAMIVHRMQAGGAERDGLLVAVADISRLSSALPSHISGLLGYNFLEAYSVTVDYPKRRVCFAS